MSLLSPRVFGLALLAATSFPLGCTTNSDLDDDAELAELAGLDEKADGFQALVKLESPLDYGAAGVVVHYTAAPRYRGLKFQATGGDHVELVVHASTDVTPVASILDENFQIVSQSQETEARADGHVGHVRLVIADGTDRTYYALVRTEQLVAADLTIDLVGTLPTPGCDEDNPVKRDVASTDRALPRAALSYMRAHGWGCMHRKWHDVRQLDFLVGLENVYISTYHPDWVRVDPQEGAEGNGLDFFAMHRVMLSALRAELPSWATADTYADLRGFAFDQLPTAPDDATWPVPVGNPRAFAPRAAQTLANLRAASFSSENHAVDTDDRFGRYLETRHRPIPGTPWNLSTDLTTGFHNYMHGRFNEPNSPVRMGNFARNIEGRVFWRLHGWLDEAWTRFRKAVHPGVRDADDPTYMGAMNRACVMMHADMGHAGTSQWDPTTARCTSMH